MKNMWKQAGLRWLGPLCLLFLSIAAPAEEEQSQGFAFEHVVIQRLTGLDKLPISHTAEWDIPAECNRVAPGLPVSVKFIKWGNEIYLGDALRQRRIDYPFQFAVGFYEMSHKDNTALVKAVHLVKVSPEDWNQWWGDVKPSELEELNRKIKQGAIEEAQDYARPVAAELRNRDGWIKVHPKINKDQRRIQCAMPFDVFYRLLLKEDPKPQSQIQLLGHAFPTEFPLGARSAQ